MQVIVIMMFMLNLTFNVYLSALRENTAMTV